MFIDKITNFSIVDPEKNSKPTLVAGFEADDIASVLSIAFTAFNIEIDKEYQVQLALRSDQDTQPYISPSRDLLLKREDIPPLMVRKQDKRTSLINYVHFPISHPIEATYEAVLTLIDNEGGYLDHASCYFKLQRVNLND